MSNLIHNIEGNWEITIVGDEDTSVLCTLIQIDTVFKRAQSWRCNQ
jgi:hypothetical protein